MIVKFPFSPELKLLFKLINKDDELRIVGGCVRDFLHTTINQNPENNKKLPDIDLACKYLPEKTIEILQSNNIKTIPTGIKHGTITALVNGKTFEITTLRKDVENYGRQAKVEFVDDFLEDAKRRDFTFNAMSIDEKGNLFDYFDGLTDLKNKKVKFIGEASARIQEDYLRILRFFRFSCYYGAKIEATTLQEIVKFKSNLQGLSSHRIRTELLKIMDCEDKNQLLYILNLMNENQILEEIIAAKKFDLPVLKNLLEIPNSETTLLKFCALIYSNKEQNWPITKKLEFSNKERKYIHDILDLSSKVNLKTKKADLIRALFDFNKDLAVDSLKINFAANYNSNKQNLDELSDLINFINNINLPDFILNGNDILNRGIANKLIGKALNELKNIWIEREFKISKEELLQILSSLKLS